MRLGPQQELVGRAKTRSRSAAEPQPKGRRAILRPRNDPAKREQGHKCQRDDQAPMNSPSDGSRRQKLLGIGEFFDIALQSDHGVTSLLQQPRNGGALEFQALRTSTLFLDEPLYGEIIRTR